MGPVHFFASSISSTSEQLYDSYTHPTFAPKGVFKPGSAEKWYTAFNWWRAFPTNATAVVEAGELQPLYTLADLVFTNEFTYNMASSEFGGSTLDFSFFPFFIVDLLDDAAFLKAIRKIKDVTRILWDGKKLTLAAT